MLQPHSKLERLKQKALAQGQYSLAAAIAYLLADLSDINGQIGVIGALHEVGYLKTSLAPYWHEFRKDEPTWIRKCVSRLVSADHDYWALAALLGCNGPKVIEICQGMGFKSAALRFYHRFDKPDVYVNTLYFGKTGRVLHPVLEVGYDAEDYTTVDLGRARALSLEDETWSHGAFIGNGSLSLSMQAKLPHGAWRVVSAAFEMKREWMVAP